MTEEGHCLNHTREGTQPGRDAVVMLSTVENPHDPSRTITTT